MTYKHGHSFEVEWAPFLEKFVASNWGKVYAAHIHDPRFGVYDLLEDYCQSITNQCIYNPDRKVNHRHNLYKVFDIYKYVADAFLAQVKASSDELDVSHLTKRYGELFPFLSQTERHAVLEGQCDLEYPSLRLLACTRLDQNYFQSCDRPLISKYLQYLASIYTGDQTRPWKSLAVRRHGIPVLVCDNCHLTPLQFDLMPMRDHIPVDRIDALARCQRHIVSKFEALQ